MQEVKSWEQQNEKKLLQTSHFPPSISALQRVSFHKSFVIQIHHTFQKLKSTYRINQHPKSGVPKKNPLIKKVLNLPGFIQKSQVFLKFVFVLKNGIGI